MKKMQLVLLGLGVFAINSLSAIQHIWTINNNTGGTISAYVRRKGTFLSDDQAKAVTIPAGATKDINLGEAYCAKGVEVTGKDGAVYGLTAKQLYEGKVIDYKCVSRTIDIGHANAKWSTPSSGSSVNVLTGTGTIATQQQQPMIIAGSGNLTISGM